MVFAVRLDTFPKAGETKVFYIGINDAAELTRIRRHILRGSRTCRSKASTCIAPRSTCAEKYGKDTFLAIQYLGTSWLPMLFAIKGRSRRSCLTVPVSAP